MGDLKSQRGMTCANKFSLKSVENILITLILIVKIGGGVLIAVKEGLQATRRCDLERDGAEFVVVQINKVYNSSVILYTYYRPPQTYSDSLKLLNNSLLSNPESSCIVLISDFNLPYISWPDNQSTIPINNGGCANGKISANLWAIIFFINS